MGKHFSVDLDTRRKGMAAFGFHLPPKSRVLNDVFLGVRQIVLCEHGANAGAPAAIGFQISSNLGRSHLRQDNTTAQNFSVEYNRTAFFLRIKDRPLPEIA